jgi:hypothetical protein
LKQELKDEFGFIGDDYDALAVASVDATIKKYQEEELHPIYLAQKRAIDNGSMTNMIDVNRIPVTVPLTGQLFGVIFLGGHISLKNRTYRPLLIERACPFKNMCVHT